MKRYSEVVFVILGIGMIAEYHTQAIAANAENEARLVRCMALRSATLCQDQATLRSALSGGT